MAVFRWQPIITTFSRYLSPVRLLTDHGLPSSNDVSNEEPFQGPVPRDRLKIKFVRSSGPGGQNVNKLSTKAEVRFNVNDANWLSSRVKTRLNKLFKTRINKEGELIVTSDKHRTQGQNIADALLKLEKFIKEADEIPKGPSELTRQRIKLLKRKSEMKRLTDKKYNSMRKNDRRID